VKNNEYFHHSLMENAMKPALACTPVNPVPKSTPEGLGIVEKRAFLLQGSNAAQRAAAPRRHGKALGRAFDIVARWVIPENVLDEMPPAIDAREVEALEEHIRKFNAKHRFTGFPC
jgi:hypothetical protein